MKILIISLQVLLLPFIALGMDDQQKKSLWNEWGERERITNYVTRCEPRDLNLRERSVEPKVFINYGGKEGRRMARKLRWQRQLKKIKEFFCCCCKAGGDGDRN